MSVSHLQIGAVLYSDFLQHNPKDPKWINRDRFVLSGGHGRATIVLTGLLDINAFTITMVCGSLERLVES